MQNQTNTSRLHRMSRITGSMRRTSINSVDGKDNFKLAAINSIRRGIKNNDVSFITKAELGAKQQGGNTIDLATVRTHESFDKVRKEYDNLQKEKLMMEKLVAKTKEEVENAKDEQLLYSNKKDGASNIVKNLEATLESKRLELEEATVEKKCLLNMLGRLRTDRITYGEKKYNFEQLLSDMKKEHSIINREGISQQQQVHRATGIKQTLEKQIREQMRKREQHLQSLLGEIDLLRQTAEIDEVRQNEIKDIRQRAHQDKGEEEKQWKELLLTHHFLGSFLTNKMDKEMEKFRIVESAFKNIKLATGVTDAQSIVKNYLNRESVYGRLLDNIAEKQKKIEKLRNERTELKKEHKQESNGPQLEHRKINDLHNQMKNLDIFSQKQLRTELERNKFASWVKRQMKKIRKIEKPLSYDSQLEEEQQKTRPDDFLQYINWMSKQLDQIQSSQKQIPEEIFKDVEHERKQIMRVKSQESDEEENSHLHTEDFNHLNVQRQQLLREGEKFMKELKRRKEQELKLEVELALKKPPASPTKKDKEKDKERQKEEAE